MASSAVSSIAMSNCPAVHLYRSVNCTSAEYSLIRTKSISKAPAAVAQKALSTTIVAFQIHGLIDISAARISRTFRIDKIGLQVIAASALVTAGPADAQASSQVSARRQRRRRAALAVFRTGIGAPFPHGRWSSACDKASFPKA